MNSVTDRQFADWAYRLGKSDEKALDELFDQTFEIFVKFAWRYTNDKSSAIDIVQDSFIKIWQIRSELDHSKSLKTYMYRVVRNNALNYLRDRKQNTVSIDDIPLEEQVQVFEHDTIDEESSLGTKLNEWIESLPDRQQQAFELSRFEGLTHEEIAEVMQVSPRTVNNHIVTALNTLKEHYDHFKASKQQVI